MVEMRLRMGEKAAETIERRAAEAGRSVDEYLAGLAMEDERRAQDALAAEGYRLLSEDTRDFVEAALPLARETWPQWDSETPGRSNARRSTCRDEILDAIHWILQKKDSNTFEVQEVIDEIRRRGTSYPDATIRTEIVSRMCANSPDNHAKVYSDLERVGRGLYRLVRGEE